MELDYGLLKNVFLHLTETILRGILASEPNNVERVKSKSRL